jgi:hypothetical protein
LISLGQHVEGCSSHTSHNYCFKKKKKISQFGNFAELNSFCFDKNASISGNFHNRDFLNKDTVIFRELPKDYLQKIFFNMERTDQNKYMHTILLRRTDPSERIICEDFTVLDVVVLCTKISIIKLPLAIV